MTPISQQAAEIARLQSQLAQARERLTKIVVTDGEDAGVVMLSIEGPTHQERLRIEGEMRTVAVYDHEYFSPLGDALMELYQGLGE